MIDEKKVIDEELLAGLESSFLMNEAAGIPNTEEEKERLRKACTSEQDLDAEVEKMLEEAGVDMEKYHAQPEVKLP